MSDIFVGLILLFFNFNLNLGASSIGLLPSFVGAYLIWKVRPCGNWIRC